MIGTVRLIHVRITEEDLLHGAIPHESYDNARTEDFEVDDIEEAVRVFQREGLDFKSTGSDWAAHPDGSRVVDYATGDREETTAHLIGFSDADTVTIINTVS